MGAFTAADCEGVGINVNTGAGQAFNPVHYVNIPIPRGADFVAALVAAINSVADARRPVAG